MEKWIVRGTQSADGKRVKVQLDAETMELARARALRHGITVESIERVADVPASPAPATVPPPVLPQPAPSQPIAYATPLAQAVQWSGAPERNVSGLGVASLILGIIACLVALIPCLGLLAFPFAVIGAVLGAVGIIVSATGRRVGVGIPIAGTATSIASFGIFLVVTAMISSAVNQAGAAAAAASKAPNVMTRPTR